jgi:hypothetical protein
MDLFVSLPVTPGGVLAAAACAVAGAPLFARGLRAFRLGRRLDGLREQALAEDSDGLVRVRGRVSLESPLFAPLSGTPCAGFQLEVRGTNSKVGGMIRDQRAFRLQSGDTSALVSRGDCDWHAPVTAERELAAREAVSERLATLLDSCNEVRWLRERGVALHVVERALEAGRVVSVVGVATHERIAADAEDAPLAATGTDGGGFQGSRMLPGPVLDTYQLQIRTDDTFPRVQVFADPPDQPLPRPSRWENAWLAIGPTLTLLALLYLARAAEPLLSRTP